MDTLTRRRVQQVHLTYLAENDSVAETVATELSRAGIRTSRSAIRPRAVSDDETVANAIRDASAVILLCTTESLRDRRIRQELQIAWRFDRPIVPILLEPLLFPDDVVYWLEGTQWIEAFDRRDAWYMDVLAALAAHGMQPEGFDGETDLPVHRSTVFLPKTEIPTPAGRLVGRETELRTLSRQLANHRLITITGPGGTGKTRLAIDLAQLVRPLFPDGVFFVELGAASGPNEVPEFIARKLRIGSFAGESFSAAVLAALRDRRLLLVLDNFEHVLAATAFVSQLLWECANLSVLITSRASTGIAGGIEFELGPFDLPENPAQLSLTELSGLAAIEFFVERAQAANPGFALTPENASDVAKLCAALDGLPLAMELMAGKSRVLTPAQMLGRFVGTPGVLSIEGAPDRPDRQRTLRQTIAWSVDLLSPLHRQAFTWLGVFSGGATLEAIESVFDRVETPDKPEALAAVESLVQQHLLTHIERPGGQRRFRMLESIRAYAVEGLDAAEDAPAVRQAHATFYLDFLADAGAGLTGPDQASWLTYTGADYKNCRNAVEWAFETEPQRLLDAVNGLWLYWAKHGGLYEGLTWIQKYAEELIEHDQEVGSKLLNMIGNMAYDLGDLQLAESSFIRCLEIAKSLQNRGREAAASLGLGHVCHYKGDYRTARQYHEFALSTAKELQDAEFVAVCLDSIADAWAAEENYPRALPLHEEALELLTELGNVGAIAYSYCRLGDINFRTHDVSAARHLMTDAISIFDQTGDTVGASYAQLLLSKVERSEGNIEECRALLRKALLTRFRERLTWLLVEVIEEVVLSEHQPESASNAVSLLALCDRQRTMAACPPTLADRKALSARIDELREVLGDRDFEIAWRAGRRFGLPEAVSLAMEMIGDNQFADAGHRMMHLP